MAWYSASLNINFPVRDGKEKRFLKRRRSHRLHVLLLRSFVSNRSFHFSPLAIDVLPPPPPPPSFPRLVLSQMKKPLFLHERQAFGPFTEVSIVLFDRIDLFNLTCWPVDILHEQWADYYHLRQAISSVNTTRLGRIRVLSVFRYVLPYLQNVCCYTAFVSHGIIFVHRHCFFWQVLRRYDSLLGLPPCLVHCFTGTAEVRRHTTSHPAAKHAAYQRFFVLPPFPLQLTFSTAEAEAAAHGMFLPTWPAKTFFTSQRAQDIAMPYVDSATSEVIPTFRDVGQIRNGCI